MNAFTKSVPVWLLCYMLILYHSVWHDPEWTGESSIRKGNTVTYWAKQIIIFVIQVSGINITIIHSIRANPQNLLMCKANNLYPLWYHVLTLCEQRNLQKIMFYKKRFQKSHAYYTHLTYKHTPLVISGRLNS